MQGEIGLKIKKIVIDRNSWKALDGCMKHSDDMHLIDENGKYLHIVGDNDLKTLLEDALKSIKE